MIKIRRNCKKIERRKLGIKRSSKARRKLGLRDFAAKRGSLRKSHSVAKKFRSPQEPLRKSLFSLRKSISAAKPFRSCFAPAAKTLLGTRVSFRSRVPPFRSWELVAIFSTPGEPLFRSQGIISKGVSQLRNPYLAHERQFTEPYARFAAAKWATKSMSNFPFTAKRNSDLWCSF